MSILALIEVLARVARERGNIPVCLGERDAELIPAVSVEFVDEGGGKLALYSSFAR